MSTETTPSVLAMSDEEFLKSAVPPVVTEGDGSSTTEVQTETQKTETTQEPTAEELAAKAEADQKAAEEAAKGKVEEDPTKVDTSTQTQEDGNLTKVKTQEQSSTAVVDGQQQVDKTKVTGKESEKVDTSGSNNTVDTPPDYENLYKKIMAPLKANGKSIDLKTPEEAVQLMQMGANYTRKMQAIAPHRKVLLMLENNGLLDESKLAFLIDLDKKNPEAIKKLIKDAGIDPLEIDTNVATTYREGNHRVTDEEAGFVTALEDLRSNPNGAETLQTINTQWDQASKDVLWKNPELMGVIHSQRENGIYTKISTEVERQKTLGIIPSHTPFIEAYKAVGDQLNASGAFADIAKQETQVTQPVQKNLLATRVQQPKVDPNAAKVSAASPTRSTPQKTGAIVNPLAMSDDDFLKQMSNRV